MLFTSSEFAIFLPIVLVVPYSLTTRAQNAFLLLASYLFYGWWDWRFVGLLWLSTLLDYGVGLYIPRVSGLKRRWVLAASIGVNLTILGFFKYFNFFVGSAAVLLAKIGFHPDLPALHVILPVGVSFYTFQSIAYTIDVYRGKVQPERNLLNYALYVAFFPQLVAGPIQRADHLIGQLAKPRTVTANCLYSGLFLLLLGYFKKIVIADSVAPAVDEIFSRAGSASWMALWRGICFFTIQIYCDFSGYTDIARGIGRLLGVELIENFRQPYLSSSVTEFWHRWHISLSTWLRDYLYISLGGNRGGSLKTYRNLMLTMLLGGLWHGANWTFVIWGGLHGCYLAVHKFLVGDRPAQGASEARVAYASLRRVACVLGTLHLVMLTWVFFRAASLTQALQYLSGLGQMRGGLAAWNIHEFALVLFYAGLVLAVDWPQFKAKDHFAVMRWPLLARSGAMAAMLMLIILLGKDSETPFIYFQF